MKDYLNIGSSPCEEDCAQVGSSGYREKSWKEIIAFKAQLRRVFGQEPKGAIISHRSFPHDFGSYTEVVCIYDDDFPDSVEYAYKLEAECPLKWDKQARQELGL